jgi:hypothetical protein
LKIKRNVFRKVKTIKINRTIGGDEEPEGYALVQGEAGDDAVLVINRSSKRTYSIWKSDFLILDWSCKHARNTHFLTK